MKQIAAALSVAVILQHSTIAGQFETSTNSMATGSRDQSEMQTNGSIRTIGGYTMMLTNGHYAYAKPGEFWRGIWKEDANGVRVQLRVYPLTNIWTVGEGNSYPISTNLMLCVEWGYSSKDSGPGYLLSPNGKFVRFQLLDSNGNEVPKKPGAGVNLLETKSIRHAFQSIVTEAYSTNLTYETNLPTWVSPFKDSFEAEFPKQTSIHVYPRHYNGCIAGETGSATNQPPHGIGLFKLDEIFTITNNGEYTLIVQPVLYKQSSPTNPETLERVDLPCVTTRLVLEPDGPVIKMR